MLYVEKLHEQFQRPGFIEEKTYVGTNVVIYSGGGLRDVRYLHLDQLGSVDAVTDMNGHELVGDAHGFDAFGKPRARDWQANGDLLHPGGDIGTATNHGFTGHEHLDDTFLIHMNGRVYDYRLGRFLSVDPFISKPPNSQSINPYSYIGNNPLSGVDPTGYESVGTGCGAFAECNVTFVNPSASSLARYAAPNDNNLKGAVQDFMKEWNGKEGRDSTAGKPASEEGSPTSVASKSPTKEPGYGDLSEWMSKNRPVFSKELTSSWSQFSAKKGESWSRSASGPFHEGFGQSRADSRLAKAFGVSFDVSTINPWTSGHGGDCGLNLEYTSDGGWHLYTFATPAVAPTNAGASKTFGFEIGVSAQFNVAMGHGDWSGLFNQAAGGFGIVSGSIFFSPLNQSDPGYFGASIGVGFGPPGIATTQTDYVRKW